jgi:cellulose synthase/poly-beta-1,6-N-acetylglucosamine synthase-like glycosyltransferase
VESKSRQKKEKRKKRYPKILTIVCVEERERERERWMVGWLVVVSYSFCFEDCSPFVSFSFILLFLLLHLFLFFFFFLTYPIAGSIGSAATFVDLVLLLDQFFFGPRKKKGH